MKSSCARITVLACLPVLVMSAAAGPAAAPPPPPPPPPWPTYHGGYNLSGAVDVKVAPALEVAWRAKLPGGVLHAPLCDGRRVFCAGERGVVAAFDMKGSNLWQRTLTSDSATGSATAYFEGAPVLAGGLLVLGSSSGMVFALDPATGADRWTYDAQEHIQGAVNYDAGTDRVIIMTQTEGVLHAVDRKTGKGQWIADASIRCDGSPAVAGGNIVYGSCAPGFHVFSAATGKETSFTEAEEDGEMAGGTALVGGRAYAGNRSGQIVAADLGRAELLWSNEDGGGELFSTPAVNADRVVFAAGSGTVFCIKRSDGEKVWEFETEGFSPGSPVIAGDKVLAVMDGTLYLLALKDGAKLWSYQLGDSATGPCLAGGLVIMGSGDGQVVAFKAAAAAKP